MSKLTTAKLLRILKRQQKECEKSADNAQNPEGIRDALCAVGVVLMQLRDLIKEATK